MKQLIDETKIDSDFGITSVAKSAKDPGSFDVPPVLNTAHWCFDDLARMPGGMG